MKRASTKTGKHLIGRLIKSPKHQLLLHISDSEMKEKYPILRAIKAVDSSTMHIKAIACEIFSMRG